MDWEKLWKMIEEYVSCTNDAAYARGIADTRRQELEEFIDECKAEAEKPVERKNIVVEMPPLPQPPPSEWRCRNCGNFLPLTPNGRETAKTGKCFARNVGAEYGDANEDLDHSWCTRWTPVEAKPAKEEQPEKTPEQTLEEVGKALAGACPMEAETPSDEEEDKEDDGDDRCGDCLYFDRRKNWCTGHNMPAIPDGNVCPDFLARSSVKCRECASFALEKWCHKGPLTLSVGESEACPSFKPRGNA